MVFELLTGDLLFDPHKSSKAKTGKAAYTRDDDHLAQMIELLGSFPKKVAVKGKYSRDFFNRKVRCVPLADDRYVRSERGPRSRSRWTRRALPPSFAVSHHSFTTALPPLCSLSHTQGKMMKIRNLKDWQLIDVLRDKYCLPTADAAPLADLLGQMLAFNPERRATAQECLAHAWFDSIREAQQLER
tara:strand:+ start:317 stop:877 length:561 start_codon:yes stop_codon:yes gene_type:complete